MRRIPVEGEKHMVTAVYILTTEEPKRILFVHHKRFDKWLPPGGHVEFGESPYEGAIREVREEAGVDISAYLPEPEHAGDHATRLPIPKYMNEERIEATEHEPVHFHIDHIYLVEVPHSEVVHDPNESHGIGWFTYDETLALPTFADVRTSLKEIFGK
ncbi:NUDIX domain-containing protein [Patescibacteria group bacterium]|nr:NUDIX domain-containing protein [Patescibacteria group bacterium]